MVGSTLTSVVDATSGMALLTLSYDMDHDLKSVTDAYGRKIVYTFGTPDGFPTLSVTPSLLSVSQIAPAGTNSPPVRRRFDYTNFFGEPELTALTVPSATGAGTATTHINYDADGKVTSVQDANGNRRVYTYGSGSTEVQVRNAAGTLVASWSQQYDGDGRDVGTTDALGHANHVAYEDPLNPDSPTRITDENGKVTQIAYDQYGNVTTVTGPRTVTTTFTYDYAAFPLGRLASVQEGDKAPATFTYFEPTGLLQSVTTAAPGTIGTTSTVTASLTYDALGNVLTVTAPGNNAASTLTTTFNYTSDPGDSAHGVAAFSQAAAVGQPLTVTDNAGKVTHLRYGVRGLPLSVTDALGHETDFGDDTSAHAGGYNLADQSLLVTLPGSGTGGRESVARAYLYPGGPMTSVTTLDKNGAQARQVSLQYGLEGEPLSVMGSTEPVSYTYDALYRLKTLADGKGQMTRYFYNPAGLLASVLYPGGDTLQFPSYDPAGNLLTRIDGRGVETDYVYNDPENLLTAVHYPASPSQDVAYGYDTYGRQSSMTDGTGTHTYAYDDLDDLLSVMTTYTGLPSKTVSYSYYPDGSRQSMGTPAGTFSYGYDAAGRPSSLTNPSGETATQTYRDNGELQTQTLGNGVTTSYEFDPRGLLTRLLHQAAGGATLADFSNMVYDAAGNRTSVTASLPGAPAGYSGTTTYLYDIRDQLLQEQSTRLGGYTNAFGYDLAGNPTTFRGAAGAFNANNQHAAFTYDKNGNPVSYKGVPLQFDAENRLTTGH